MSEINKKPETYVDVLRAVREHLVKNKNLSESDLSYSVSMSETLDIKQEIDVQENLINRIDKALLYAARRNRNNHKPSLSQSKSRHTYIHKV